MSPVLRLVDLLRVGAAGVLAAVTFVPYVAVGEQAYGAIGFFWRINALSAMQTIDGSWRVPPALALASSASALFVIALPGARSAKAQLGATVLACVAAVVAYRLTGQSAILQPLLGPKLLIVGASLSTFAVMVDQATHRSGTRAEGPNQLAERLGRVGS